MRLSFAGLLLAATVGLNGCGTWAAPPYVPAPPAPPGYATVYIYRVGAYPTLMTPDVHVSDARVFDPPEKAYTWVHVKQGDQTLRVHWSDYAGWPSVAYAWTASAGQSYYIRISGGFGDVRTDPVTQKLVQKRFTEAPLVDPRGAQVELASCCRYMKAKVEQIR